jgi:hypothetical protein
LFIANKSISKHIIVISQNFVINEKTKVIGFEYRGLFCIGKGSLSKCGKVLEVRFMVELQTFSLKQSKLVTNLHVVFEIFYFI